MDTYSNNLKENETQMTPSASQRFVQTEIRTIHFFRARRDTVTSVPGIHRFKIDIWQTAPRSAAITFLTVKRAAEINHIYYPGSLKQLHDDKLENCYFRLFGDTTDVSV